MTSRSATTVRGRRRPPAAEVRAVAKVSSGIRGLDEITGGGLPRGRPTLVCGGPGCGKTLFLGASAGAAEESDVAVSSLIDTWLQLEWVSAGAERRRYLTVVKSRGMPHAVEAVPFRPTGGGVELPLAGRWDGEAGGKERP